MLLEESEIPETTPEFLLWIESTRVVLSLRGLPPDLVFHCQPVQIYINRIICTEDLNAVATLIKLQIKPWDRRQPTSALACYSWVL